MLKNKVEFLYFNVDKLPVLFSQRFQRVHKENLSELSVLCVIHVIITNEELNIIHEQAFNLDHIDAIHRIKRDTTTCE